MQRVLEMVVAAMLVSNGEAPAVSSFDVFSPVSPSFASPAAVSGELEVDVTALLAAARGAPPLICALAAQAVRGNGWGDWSDAPSTPLPRSTVVHSYERDEQQALSNADVQQLLDALGSPTRACGSSPCAFSGTTRVTSSLPA